MYKYKNSYIFIFSFMNNIILCLYNFKTLKQLMCVYFIKLRNNLYLIYIKIKV